MITKDGVLPYFHQAKFRRRVINIFGDLKQARVLTERTSINIFGPQEILFCRSSLFRGATRFPQVPCLVMAGVDVTQASNWP